jgi:hypothetical protein
VKAALVLTLFEHKRLVSELAAALSEIDDVASVRVGEDPLATEQHRLQPTGNGRCDAVARTVVCDWRSTSGLADPPSGLALHKLDLRAGQDVPAVRLRLEIVGLGCAGLPQSWRPS